MAMENIKSSYFQAYLLSRHCWYFGRNSAAWVPESDLASSNGPAPFNSNSPFFLWEISWAGGHHPHQLSGMVGCQLQHVMFGKESVPDEADLSLQRLEAICCCSSSFHKENTEVNCLNNTSSSPILPSLAKPIDPSLNLLGLLLPPSYKFVFIFVTVLCLHVEW